MKPFKKLILIIITGAALFLTGCAGSTHSTIYYDSYYDPYPYWGHGNDTTIIIDRPDNRPKRPPGINPPGGNRPSPSPKRR
jgi:hypothetical protein